MNVRRTLVVMMAGAAVGLASFSLPVQAGLVGGGGNTVNALFFFGSHTVANQEIEDFGSPPVTGPAPIGAGGVDFVSGQLDLSTIHVGDTSITITNLAPNTSPFCTSSLPCTDSFTGFEFQFSAGVDITNVTVDPASATAFLPITGGLSFTSTDILVNVAGDAPNPGDPLILDLTFPTTEPPTIPEPMSLLLLLSSMVGIAGARHARMRSRASGTVRGDAWPSTRIALQPNIQAT